MIGETIGDFKIVSRLGRGGMGEVWLAEQQSIGTKVAIKLLNAAISEDTEHVQRFFNEARAVSRIQHAGIVKIWTVGHHNGHAYLVMEYLEGESLGQRIARDKRIPLGDLCEIGRQAASVLDATHSAGITHRDLKPDNIYVIPDRELACGYRVKILDFGIAKLTGTLAGVSPRTTGAMGTPAYMAPEQWGDASQVDWRADLYSLGCVAFEMAAGRPPFIVTNIAEACAKHLHDAPPHLQSLAPDLPSSLDALVDRLLAKSPTARAESMREVERAFVAIAAGQPFGLAATLPSIPPTSRSPLAPSTISASQPPGVVTTPAITPDHPRAAPRKLPTFLILGALAIIAVTTLIALRMMMQHATPLRSVSREHHGPRDAAVPVDAAIAAAVMPDAAPPLADAGVGAVGTPTKKATNGKQVGTKPIKEGTIDAEGVFQAAVHDRGIELCYRNEVTKDPTLGGKLTASLWIDETGHATSVSATGVSAAVERCVERRLKAIQYPKAIGGPVNAYLPFTFEPPSADELAKGGAIDVKSGGAELRATPTATDIKLELSRLHNKLEACGTGSVRLEITIAPDGKATEAKVHGAEAGTELATCVEQALVAHAKFPKSTGGIKTLVSIRLAK